MPLLLTKQIHFCLLNWFLSSYFKIFIKPLVKIRFLRVWTHNRIADIRSLFSMTEYIFHICTDIIQKLQSKWQRCSLKTCLFYSRSLVFRLLLFSFAGLRTCNALSNSVFEWIGVRSCNLLWCRRSFFRTSRISVSFFSPFFLAVMNIFFVVAKLQTKAKRFVALYLP